MKATSGLPKLGGGGQSSRDRDQTEVDRRVNGGGGVKEWGLSVPTLFSVTGPRKGAELELSVSVGSGRWLSPR